MAERFAVEQGGSSVTDALINKLKSVGRHLNPKSNDLACIPQFRNKSRSKIIDEEFLISICSIFPEDFRIPIQDLVSYGMSLDLFEDGHDMFSTRYRVHDIISTINDKKYSQTAIGGQIRLALEKDGPLDRYVKVLVGSRDASKLITSRYPFVFRREIVIEKWPESKWFEDCYGLSLVFKKVNAYPSNVEFPKLTLLRLQYREDSEGIPVDFLKNMKELRVLSLDLPSLLHSLHVLRNLRTLHLKVPRIEDMSWIGGLINLEFLSISVSSLTDIPRELGQLERLRLLDLRKMNIAYIPPGVLSRLLKLEELYFPSDFRKWGCKAKKIDDYDEWESGEEDNYEDEVRIRADSSKIDDGGRTNASLIEIVSLSLNALQICVPEASLFPKKSPIFKNIQEFNIFVSHSALYQPFGKYSANVLQLMGEACDIGESAICDLLSKAEELSLTRVQNLRNGIRQLNGSSFPLLKKMIISECNELEYIAGAAEKQILPESGYVLGKLECLHLSMLSNLKEIFHERMKHYLWFSNLSQISIRFCPKLRYICPLSIFQGLSLKSMEILDCYGMEGVFCEDQEETIPQTLCSIERLELHSLPRFISFLVHMDEIVDDAQDEVTQSLATNEVSVVKNNVAASQSGAYSAFSSRFEVKWFQNLKSLKVAFCDLVKVVFSFKENHASSKAFHSLEVLELYGLRNLVHTWLHIPPKNTSFRNLQLLLLSECGCSYLFTCGVAKLLVQLQKVYISRCEKMKEIIGGKCVENEGKGRVVLPRLRLLELQCMPNLQILFGVSREIKLPLLKSLKFKDCGKMKSISDGLLKMPMLEGVEVDGSFHLLTKDQSLIFTGVPTPHKFTLADLRIATNSFIPHNILWRETNATVFKGWIDRMTFAPSKTSTGMPVSVMAFMVPCTLRRDVLEWEVGILGRRFHPNVVRLIGYCFRVREAALVHEYIPGGNLFDRLVTREPGIEPLSWDMRVKIAIGAARGLNYLHTSEPETIHREIKISNILLDTNCNAKIVGFDATTRILVEESKLTSTVRLPVYVDPVLFRSGNKGQASMKADVYSFGVVLSQLMAGFELPQLNQEKAKGTKEKLNSVERLKLILSQERELKDIVDSTMEGQYSSKAMLLMAELAMKCIQEDTNARPTMGEVLEKLQEIDAINQD